LTAGRPVYNPRIMEDLADPEVGRRPRRGAGAAAHPEATLRAQLAHSLSGNTSTHARATAGRVLVLNASYEPINVCTVRRATVLLLKARAEVLEKGEGALHSELLELDRPCVIRLVRYVRIPRDVHRRKITRKAVLARDSYTCQYCGREASGLTVDHVIPRSRGGESVWENIVASCAPCNRKKGNRMPREAQMHPANRPRPPGPTVFIRIAAPRVPVAWEPYLIAA
jgi:5-methylcytosine-specific restriction endonuclease McrA